MEQYQYVGPKKLRCGYTTGSCAAAAAQAAVCMLLGAADILQVQLTTPKGVVLQLEILNICRRQGSVSCMVQKDSGDDPDSTNGVLVGVTASFSAAPGVTIEGGEGVGRVTKPGLECPVGSAAINRVPCQMIRKEVERACQAYKYTNGINITIFIPNGKEIAQHTYNPRLGIVDGISILGTTGIVEPMSEKALVDTIQVEMKVQKAAGAQYIGVTPGNYGEEFTKREFGVSSQNWIKCSNFVGETLDYSVQLGFSGVLLVGHLGKFVKLAAGIMNTHSRYADGRMEILSAHAALAGADKVVIQKIMNSITTDQAVEELANTGLLSQVMDSLLIKIHEAVCRRAGQLKAGVVVYSNKHGLLGKTEYADWLLNQLRNEEYSN